MAQNHKRWIKPHLVVCAPFRKLRFLYPPNLLKNGGWGRVTSEMTKLRNRKLSQNYFCWEGYLQYEM